MRVEISPAVTAAWLVSGIRPPDLNATFVVKGSFRLIPGGTATAQDAPDAPSGDLIAAEGPTMNLRYESDFAPVKLRSDLLLVGSCYAPDPRGVRACRVRFGVGKWSKVLAVFGNRRWTKSLAGTTATTPEPFARMPLGWSRAFGGPRYERNPAGRGFGTELLPNVESLGALVASPGDRPEPASFGPIHRTLPQRNRNLGTYNDEWLRKLWPWPPRDFDWSHHNAAPKDQQFVGFLRGDEDIVLENMHPRHSWYASRLPGVRPQVFLVETIEASRRVREVPLVLDTLWIDADQEKLLLVWRGLATVRSLKLVELDEVHVAVTRLQEAPLTWSRYWTGVQALEQKERDEVAAAAAQEAEADRKFEEEFAQLRAESDQIIAAATKEAAAIRDLSLQTMANAGVDAAAALTPLAQASRLNAALATLAKEAPEHAVTLPPFSPALESTALASDVSEWTRERCQQHLASGTSLADADLADLDLSDLDFNGADLSRASLRGCLLVGAMFKMARLSDADLWQADLSGADLSDAEMQNVDATQAIFTGATLKRARLNRATLVRAVLVNADMQAVDATAADFSAADLTQVRAVQARFDRADFSDAKLEGASLDGATMADATVEGARGARVSMIGADLTGLRAGNAPDFAGGTFREARADNSYWEGAKLDGADFRWASLVRAAFPFASLRGARFDAANIPQGSFADANLERAVFTAANLFQGSLERARLQGADLRLSNLFEAELWDAQCQAVRLDGANLKMTKLAAR